MMPRLGLLLFCLVVAACSRDGGPAEAPTWTLRETVRIGSGDEGPMSFAWIKGLAEGKDGRLYVYEHSTQDIRVFDPTGAYLMTIGRKGAGPGELGNAEGIAFGADGALWVRDAANGRFSRFDADGKVLEAWTMTYCWSQGTWAPLRTERYLVDYDCRLGGSGEYAAIGYRVDRSGVDSLAMFVDCGGQALNEASSWVTRTESSVTRRPIPWAPRMEGTLDATGATWCAPNTAVYELLRFTPGGDTVRVARDIAALPVMQDERDSVIAEFESSGPSGLDFSRIPATKPIIVRLTVDDRNRLWVRRDGANGGVLFDIVTPEGRHEATVTLNGVRTSWWSPFVVHGDAVLLVTLGEDDVQSVGRFVIDRGR
jgi:hypothetical protein